MRKGTTVLVAILLMLAAAAVPATGEARSRQLRGLRVMPGGVVVGDRIVYEGGDVIVVPAEGESFDSCSSGYVCLFEDTAWQGNLIQLSACCAWNDLSGFGFNNLASSWRNRKNVDGQIAMGAGGGGTRLCLNNNSYSSTMPSGWDNNASSIRVRDASTYC
jgi:Peptidase inhibitor family I36